jgi:hypothetical protein
MTHPQLLDIETLHEAFKKARRLGVRVWWFVHHTPRVIELLFPAAHYPGLSVHDRAIAVETTASFMTW